MSNILEAYVASNDQVLLAKAGDRFVPLSPVTEWYRTLWSDGAIKPGVSAFLDHFLEDAEKHWNSAETQSLSSGPFMETVRGQELPLEARAMKIAGRAVLVLHHLGDAFQEQQQLLQAARENLLSQELLEREVSKRTAEIRGRELEIAERLIYAAGFRDEETGAHIRRIGFYSGAMARAIGWNPLEVDDIQIAAPMHDIGKIGIPDSILKKPGRLNDEEFAIMQKHTSIGRDMLHDSKVPMLKIAAEIAGGHHEYWDGSGYPEGKKGQDIPISARIVSIVDVYDALVHSRVYKAAFQEPVALDMMRELVGVQFDPELFEVFVANIEEMRDIRNRVSDSSL
ncbi:MAG: HD-GYP domain-containing protein [Pseudomonadales bacterium]